jgi:hypothetical protein
VSDSSSRPTAKQTLLLILLPMLGTVLCLRLYLHLVRVQHVSPGGYLVHHLFVGVLIELPAAFILALGHAIGCWRSWLRRLSGLAAGWFWMR